MIGGQHLPPKINAIYLTNMDLINDYLGGNPFEKSTQTLINPRWPLSKVLKYPEMHS